PSSAGHDRRADEALLLAAAPPTHEGRAREVALARIGHVEQELGRVVEILAELGGRRRPLRNLVDAPLAVALDGPAPDVEVAVRIQRDGGDLRDVARDHGRGTVA